MSCIWISGASGGIANALINHYAGDDNNRVVALSRSAAQFEHNNVVAHQWCASTPDVGISGLLRDLPPDIVIACQGILHDEHHQPEKNLSQLSLPWLQHSVEVNLWSHIALAQQLAPVVRRLHPLRWVSLSAMVGSIEDNRLGGWYSYRMSKAALNMFIKNLSLEWQRKSPQSCVVAMHPGTTDTALSQPFQANIAAGKLYQSDTTASRIAAVIEALTAEQSGALYHWDGSRLPW
jgi:NAD(P)-dependent dehydrogenase (short-subunit alcohol dehydrogenase family)